MYAMLGLQKGLLAGPPLGRSGLSQAPGAAAAEPRVRPDRDKKTRGLKKRGERPYAKSELPPPANVRGPRGQ
ncbi:hypothetical protein NDU88_000593 [Pleurodeles waltl]|uniref:Uncharacterized protein n=1 Tax=Pleurodeles waltl TaxID=8319 RepID=A0AAV7NHN4_PLEWA|nr:hypothetical protein NDU88_000593 [Pleurodeles waltl]